MKNQTPSLFRVISTDYPSFLSVLFPIVFGGFTIYFFLSENDSLQLFLLLTIVVTVLGIPFLIQRYRMISSVLTEGVQVPGIVTRIGFFRGRGRVEYSYTAQGEKQMSSNAINKNSRTKELKVGHTVKVSVDRSNPKRAFIREIYL
ncbi:MAG: DUF3592 domain-containing protein [Anaerolineales bacterium]